MEVSGLKECDLNLKTQIIIASRLIVTFARFVYNLPVKVGTKQTRGCAAQLRSSVVYVNLIQKHGLVVQLVICWARRRTSTARTRYLEPTSRDMDSPSSAAAAEDLQQEHGEYWLCRFRHDITVHM